MICKIDVIDVLKDLTNTFSFQPFDKCFLGASSDGDPDTMFCGQMSAVYLFNEYLTANQVAAIYSLGPGYKVCIHKIW